MASLFVSDLHLDASAEWAIDAFVHLTESEARRADALYILGDLFEAWVGDDQSGVAAERVCAALRALTTHGTPCFLLHGNRDFLLGEAFCHRTGALLLPDPVVADIGGTATLLTHGDILCVDDHSYQELRTIVRTARWQHRYLRLPLATRTLLADEARAGSRAHTQRVAPAIMDVDERAVVAAFRASNTRRMIHGHTHRPATHEHTVDGERATRIVLDAWYERASYLLVDAARSESIELARA
jgi:UDP-2,3-diacylglucosamine hydrolase